MVMSVSFRIKFPAKQLYKCVGRCFSSQAMCVTRWNSYSGIIITYLFLLHKQLGSEEKKVTSVLCESLEANKQPANS